MNTSDDDKTCDAIKAALDERAYGIDGATLSRLRQARAHALAQPRGWRRWLRSPGWIPAGALAGIAAVLLTVNILQGDPDAVMPEDATALEVIALGEDLELLEELDFYEWLESQSENDQHA